MTQKQAKEKIKKLVEKYEKLSEADKKKYNEQQTKDHFIRPLFEALGWNFEEDVWPETDVSGKRVDYAFKIDGITKFFIEAKSIPVNLDEERWAEQAINYSWHKSVPWVILTDFEAIKIYNTEWEEPNIQSCQYFEIPYDKFLTDGRLWLLSRDAFKKGLLNKKADKDSRRPKTYIDKQLAADLVRWRDLLYKDLCAYNRIIDKRKISEYVQRILDRLIFIRTLEDRGIEDHILQPLVREWEEKGRKSNQLLLALNKEFRKIDKVYNSGLFEENVYDYLGDKLDADDNTFVEVINELYKTKWKGIRYNFDDIPSDIFGSIYEQYLGHIQQEDTKEKKSSKRKSQGIYYTPRYIVEYIVENTLGEVLKNKKPSEIKNLKILDPACGSGSFLISAYQNLIDYWQSQTKERFRGQGDKLEKLEKAFKKKNGDLISPEEKMRILRDNIYGVDLDEEAAELAKLNLLLKMVGKRAKLPNLSHNIQVGNSLISGTQKELKEYFGKDWKEKKPFNWEEKLPEVFSQGGFDVVIGNPPYIRPHNLDTNFKKYSWNKYKVFKAKSDIYAIFIQKAIDLLKNKGLASFIVSSTWLSLESFQALRMYVLDNCKINSLIILPSKVFEQATVETIIFNFQKESDNKIRGKNKIDIFKFVDNSFIKLNEINQSDFINTHLNIFDLSIKDNNLLSKMENISEPLEYYVDFYYGLKTGDDKKFIAKNKKDKQSKKLLRRSDFQRYKINFNNEYVWYVPDLMKKHKTTARPGDKKRFENPKILIQDINKKLIATFDDQNYYIKDALILHKKKEVDLKYLLVLINSTLLNYWYSQKFKTLGIAKNSFLILPIYKIDFSNKKEKAKHDELVKLADKMLNLNKKLQELDPLLDKEEYEEIRKEIDKTDKEINEKVYKLYGLREGEIRIIEGK